MNIETLRNYALSKPGAVEGFPFGPETLVFKVNAKIFLLVSLDTDPLRFSVKTDPEKTIAWREEFPCVSPGYHLNKKHWNTIIADGSVSGQQLKEWIDLSFELVNSVRVKKAIKK